MKIDPSRLCRKSPSSAFWRNSLFAVFLLLIMTMRDVASQACSGTISNWFYARHATNALPRDHGTNGDIVFDASGLIYSITSMNGAITILK